VGVPIQKENEALWGPEERQEENGDSGVCESAVNSPSGVWGRATAKNGFDPRRSPLLTALQVTANFNFSS